MYHRFPCVYPTMTRKSAVFAICGIRFRVVKIRSSLPRFLLSPSFVRAILVLVICESVAVSRVRRTTEHESAVSAVCGVRSRDVQVRSEFAHFCLQSVRAIPVPTTPESVAHSEESITL